MPLASSSSTRWHTVFVKPFASKSASVYTSWGASAPPPSPPPPPPPPVGSTLTEGWRRMSVTEPPSLRRAARSTNRE